MAAAHQRELVEQQLLEREPAPRRLLIVLARGKCAALSAAPRSAQPLTRAQRGRQRLSDVIEGGEVLAHHRQDLRRGQPVGGGVVRDHPCGWPGGTGSGVVASLV